MEGNIRELRNVFDPRPDLLLGLFVAEAVESVLGDGRQDAPATHSNSSAPIRAAGLHGAQCSTPTTRTTAHLKTAQALHVSRNTVYRELRESGDRAD